MAVFHLNRAALIALLGGFLAANSGLATAAAAVVPPGVQAPEIAAAPSEVGSWQAPRRWPTIGIHAAVLPTGEVLHFAYDNYATGIEAVVWNPARNTFKTVDWKPNLFCSGHSYLADGSIYVTGGNSQTRCETAGIEQTHVFDPFDKSWERLDDMRAPRYYPTNLTLGDGSVLILSGFNADCKRNSRMERYIPGKKLKLVKGGKKPIDIYPRVHLLPDGRVAHVGPEDKTSIFDPEKEKWQPVASTLLGKLRLDGTSFLVPGKPWAVMICGGNAVLNAEPTETCEEINFAQEPPRWRSVPSMRYPKAHGNAVILPDKTVLIVGGGEVDLYDVPHLYPELYDPETESWRVLPRQRMGRMYHSTAVLLPDGRVLSAGQDNDHEHDNQASTGLWGEIYKPAYLYRGPRPKIRKRSMPERVAYGEKFQIKVKQAARIESAVLVRPSAVTHSVNSTQRLIELDLEHLEGRDLELRVPGNVNLLPPGYYMLFVLNDRGVPSRARFVQVLPREAIDELEETAGARAGAE